MAVASPAAACFAPRPKSCLAGRLRAPSPSSLSAVFSPNFSHGFPSLAITASPRLNPKSSPSRAARLRSSCLLSSQLPLPSGTPLATDPSTVRTVAAMVAAFIHEKLAFLLSHAPTAEELARFGAFALTAARHVVGLGPNGSAADFRAPLLALAGVASKWVGLYSDILMVVCLLTWFPNIPWERQPLSAMRDLTDPYMRLFRGIVPPIFGRMDVSTLIGFVLLGVVRSLLNTGGLGDALMGAD